MRNIFRGHVPAPVPVKPLEVPGPSLKAKDLDAIVKQAKADQMAQHTKFYMETVEPEILAKAKQGDTAIYVYTENGMQKQVLYDLARAQGFKVTQGNGSVFIQWGDDD